MTSLPLRWVAALLLAALPALPVALHAETPAATREQSPGWYRIKVGDIQVIALLDGTAKLPVLDYLTRAPKEQLRAQLRKNFLPDQVETSVTAFLVDTGSKRVLVDTGQGADTMDGSKPRLLANLRAAGYRPEQVDEVCITHMHGDHIGGLAANGRPAFPKATLRIDQHDASYWLDPAEMKKAPPDFQGYFKLATEMVKPYAAAGRFKPFEGPQEIVPGVHAMPAHGHTPGHTIYRVESKGETLVLWGDLMHVAAVQFEHPEVAITFDTDSDAAVRERAKAFGEAADKGWMAAAAHLPFPGVGHLRRAEGGPGFTWVPLNYSLLKD